MKVVNHTEEIENYFKDKEEKQENLCLRCGTCCGAYDGDPCARLKKDGDGKYYCEIYDSRLGLRKTVKGNLFRCVPVEEILNDDWFRKVNCPYKNLILLDTKAR